MEEDELGLLSTAGSFQIPNFQSRVISRLQVPQLASFAALPLRVYYLTLFSYLIPESHAVACSFFLSTTDRRDSASLRPEQALASVPARLGAIQS